jgi:hypothetical protein
VEKNYDLSDFPKAKWRAGKQFGNFTLRRDCQFTELPGPAFSVPGALIEMV